MNRLGVNIDHVATIRQARRADEPDPVWAAVEAELGGADGITFHLREDRRHINDRDAELLQQTVATKLNMELATDPGIVKIAVRLKPDQCTLVPERREEITTEGGLDVARLRRRIRPVVQKLKTAGIITSAFIEPEPEQVRASAACGFDAIELWTGAYAHARTETARNAALAKLVDALEMGWDAGLVVHAGHGLTYRNIGPIAELGTFEEFNIGHTIIARAVFMGLREAVREMKRLLELGLQRAESTALEVAAEPGPLSALRRPAGGARPR
ncbi:MAG: pyridoxine 5'-phosphate synthase [Planctomycetota bacterium]